MFAGATINERQKRSSETRFKRIRGNSSQGIANLAQSKKAICVFDGVGVERQVGPWYNRMQGRKESPDRPILKPG